MRDDTIPAGRRGFLGRLLGGAAALAAGFPAVAPHLEAAARAPRRQATPWDDSWTQRLTGTHKQVFDSPDIADGEAMGQAARWLSGYKAALGASDSDCSAVFVFRHRAIPVALNDDAWDRYELGKEFKLDDPTTGKRARRNPFINLKPDDPHALLGADAGLDRMMQRGAVALCCNLALMGFAGEYIRPKDKVDHEEAVRRAHSALLPGVIVQPNGIYAVSRAQEAGCHYLRSA